jgi:transcriptional regulator with XRE-family HTH domain
MRAAIARPRPANPSTVVGRRVRELRLALRLSQEGLAERAGIHVTYLSSLENGKRNPTLKVLAALAEGLQIPLFDLFKDAGG